jgi:hypothetical protein
MISRTDSGLAHSSHSFGWMRSGDGFSKQRRRKLIQCTFKFELKLKLEVNYHHVTLKCQATCTKCVYGQDGSLKLQAALSEDEQYRDGCLKVS